MLARADQVEVLALDLVHHGVHIGLAHDALDDVAVDHEGGDAVGEALVDHEVAAIGQHGLVQAGDVTHQIVKAVAGDATRGVHVDAVEALHDLGVVGDVELRHLCLAEALHLDVAAVVRANGDARVDHLGDDHHDLVERGFSVLLLLLHLRHAVGVGLDGGVVRVDLRLQRGLLGLIGALFQLAVERAVRLGELVALGLDRFALADCFAALSVEGDGLVDEGQLGVLELLTDVLLDSLGIFPDKFDIKHVLFSFYVSRET